MLEKDGITWFKNQFRNNVAAAVLGTPFTLDLLAAIAIQESYGDTWGLVYKTKSVDEVLQLCVGDTLDYPDRANAFPKNKNDLETAVDGNEMFDIAHDALLQLAKINSGYAKVASNPSKFCHGYGIFQYDIQFFDDGNPQFFLQKKWYNFDECLKLCLGELQEVANTLYPRITSLTDDQMIYVAIGYNIGAHKVHVGAGYNQGHQDNGHYYGQNIADYLQLAHTIP